MPAGPLPVLFTHFGDPWIRGSERLLLDLVTHLDPLRVKPILWCNGDAMARAARTAGIETRQTEFAYFFDHASPRFSARQYRSLVREGSRLAAEHGTRVLHANSAAPAQWLLPVARGARLPLLAHLHTGYQRRARYVCLLHHATHVVGVSGQALQGLAGDGMAPGRTSVIHNGIDPDRLRVPPGPGERERLGIPAAAVVVASIGSLIPRKGHDLLLRAVAAAGHRADMRLLLVSDGPERGTLERLAAELGIEARVHFLGHRDDIGRIYAACDIVALASRDEAFGLVLAEAGLFSRPVVATAVGGIPEVVVHGATGLLTPPEDVAALTQALLQLACDPALRGRLGAAARDRAAALFEVGAMAARFTALYERLATLPKASLGWAGLGAELGPYLRLFGRGSAGGKE